jgi:hypothetical protein
VYAVASGGEAANADGPARNSHVLRQRCDVGKASSFSCRTYGLLFLDGKIL